MCLWRGSTYALLKLVLCVSRSNEDHHDVLICKIFSPRRHKISRKVERLRDMKQFSFCLECTKQFTCFIQFLKDISPEMLYFPKTKIKHIKQIQVKLPSIWRKQEIRLKWKEVRRNIAHLFSWKVFTFPMVLLPATGRENDLLPPQEHVHLEWHWHF